MDFGVASIEHIKSELKARLSFLHLVSALIPNLLSNSGVFSFYQEMGEWVDRATESEIRSKAQEVIEKLDHIVQLTSEKLPLKKNWINIAADHWETCRSGEFSFNTGILHGWLAERFDCTALYIPNDMPYHARIGVGHHAGYAAVEEDFLLRDAFFMLIQCRSALASLEAIGPELRGQRKLSKSEYARISTLNQNVATYARYAVFGFYSFVECFLNSVGEDFLRRNPAVLSEEQREILRGKRNGRHLSTERKIEIFPSIIRKDGMRPIITSDRNQIAEPFKSFVSDVKEVRDATTHFAVYKSAIVISPQTWEQRATLAARTCLAVARDFWLACYPGRNLPLYLGELDEHRHIAIAQKRVTALEQASC